MKSTARPLEDAQRVRKTLQGVFEAYYQFDLDFLKKENLGKSVQQFEKFRGVTPFVISYVAQNGLGGHSIPIDKSLLLLCYVLGIISEDEATKGKIPGLERTIPKSKGIEFASLVHPFAVEFGSAPFSTKVREKILKLAPDAAERFPKRASKKKAAEPKAKAAATKKATAKPAAKAAPKKAAAKAAPAKKAPVKKSAVKKAAAKKKVTPSKKKAPAKKVPAKKAPVKKTATKKKATKKAAPKKPAKRKK
jgi:endonuclease-3